MKMQFIILLIGICLNLSCKKPPEEIRNLNNGQIDIMGHGGMGIGHFQPLNTIESIQKCLELGAEGTEIDVQMTQDSVLVAFHYADLEEATNSKGKIADLYWHEIEGAQYTQSGKIKASVVTLRDLLLSVNEPTKYKFSFDCKFYSNSTISSDFHSRFISSLNSIIMDIGFKENISIESGDVAFLNSAQTSIPNSSTFIYAEDYESGLKIANSNKLNGISISFDNISTSEIGKLHNENLLVVLWNVHSQKDNREAVLKNPDAIQTDRVRHLVSYMNLQE